MNTLTLEVIPAAGSSAIYGVGAVPVAVNAGTCFGIDPSAANNYGLGPQYMSANMIASSQIQQQAAPSIWWLIAFALAVVVLG